MSLKLQEFLALVSVTVTFIGVPAFGKLYQRAQDLGLRDKQRDKVRIFNLTGVANPGMWTLDSVVGHNYWRRTPKEATIVVREGERVVLRVQSADVTHALYIPELGVGPVSVEPGHMKVVRFAANRPGVYTIYCAKMCGECHFFMRATLVVQGHDGKLAALSNAEKASRLCLLHTPPPPPPPSASAVERGKWLFEHRLGCIACHGSGGRGEVRNPNTEGNEVPALNRLAEFIVSDQQQAQKLLSLIERRFKQGKSLDDLKEPWLEEYHAIKKVILEGRQPTKKDPKGPTPPLYMPSWKGKVKSADIDALIAYLVSLFPEEEWESWSD